MYSLASLECAAVNRWHDMSALRPVVVSAALVGPMRLRSPVFSGLQDQQTPEPLQAVMQLGLVLVKPATDIRGF